MYHHSRKYRVSNLAFKENLKPDTIKIEKKSTYLVKFTRDKDKELISTELDLPVQVVLSTVCSNYKIVCIYFNDGISASDYEPELRDISEYILDDRGYYSPNDFFFEKNKACFVLIRSLMLGKGMNRVLDVLRGNN